MESCTEQARDSNMNMEAEPQNAKRPRGPINLHHNYFDSNDRPRICELHAGLTAMARTLSSFVFVVAMLAEILTHFHGYQSEICPDADIQSDCKAKPWFRWKEARMLALIVIVGVSCQPFSDAGKRKFGADDRAWDALLVCDAAVKLEAIFIVLENVINYTDLDHIHGVWTKIQNYFKNKGYVLVRVLKPKHCYCGGHTYRARVVPIFIKDGLQRLLDLTPLIKLSFSEPTPEASLDLELDRTRNWGDYGTFNPRSMVLRLDRGLLVPAAIVKLPGSKREWRVQAIRGDRVHLQVTDR